MPSFALAELIKLGFISQFYSVISAGQVVGEASKIYMLGKGKREAEQVAMSVLIDKIIGIIGLSVVALLGLALTATALPKSLSIGLLIAMFSCLAIIFLIRSRLIYGFLLKCLKYCLKRLNKLNKIFSSTIRLIEAWYLYSKKMKIIFLSIFFSIIFQLAQVGVYFALSRGLKIDISFFDWCWLSAIVGGLTVLPITIGGLGVREASLVGLLGFFKIIPEQALALSFSFFLVQLILAAIGGLIETRRTKIYKLSENKI